MDILYYIGKGSHHQNRLKNNDGKIEALAVLQAQQNLVLTEIKTRLEFLIENKRKSRNDRQSEIRVELMRVR